MPHPLYNIGANLNAHAQLIAGFPEGVCVCSVSLPRSPKNQPTTLSLTDLRKEVNLLGLVFFGVVAIMESPSGMTDEDIQRIVDDYKEKRINSENPNPKLLESRFGIP